MITEETLNILDDIEELSDKILDSSLYHSFKIAEQNLQENDEAHLLYQAF